MSSVFPVHLILSYGGFAFEKDTLSVPEGYANIHVLRACGEIGRHARFRNIRASNGDMAELADASDLGSDGATRAGSSPVILTIYGQI